MFTFDYFQNDFAVFIRSTNETELIERVLKRIPSCSIDDHQRQRSILYTFHQWTRFAHFHHLRYWISHETLVGYVHFHRILPHVRTIDVSILVDDTPDLIRLEKQNFSSIFQLKIHPEWSMRKTSNRSLFLENGIDFRHYNAQFIDRRTNISINLWPVFDRKSKDETLFQNDSNDSKRNFPENWIFPLRPCFFSGIKVWCPAEPKYLVETLYKSSLTTSNRRFC